MPDPRDLRPFRAITVIDVDDNSYRLVGDYLERRDAILEAPDRYEVCLLCAMEPGKVLEMTQQVRSLQTHDKETIHDTMKDYITFDDNALHPAPGLHLFGLIAPGTYMQPGHPWKRPAVLSKRIARVE